MIVLRRIGSSLCLSGLLGLLLVAPGADCADDMARAGDKVDPEYRELHRMPVTAGSRTLDVSGLLRARFQKNPGAIRAILAKTRISPLNKNLVNFWRGMAFKTEKRYEEAAIEFSKCTDFTELSTEGQLQVAETFMFLESYDKAIDILNTALKRKVNYECLELRGRTYLASNQTAKALADFTAAAKLREIKGRGLLARAADILRREHKPKEALVLLKTAEKNADRPSDCPYYMSKAACHEDLGQWSEAVECCTRGIALAKQYNDRFQTNELLLSRAYLERAKCYDRLGKASQANADRQSYRKFSNSVEEDILGK